MFPYNDDPEGHNMWSGYFTSRPAFKGYVRSSSALFNAARQLQALAAYRNSSGTALPPASSPSSPLFRLERAMGVAQHHDAVSGTAKQVVDSDYSKILATGVADAEAGVSGWLAASTGFSDHPFLACPLANVTICPSLEGGGAMVVLVHNSLGISNSAPIRLPVGFPSGVVSYAVSDAQGVTVEAQFVPLSQRDMALRALYGGNMGVNVQWLAFIGEIPAAGYTAFFLTPCSEPSRAPSTHFSTIQSSPLTPLGGDTTTEDDITLTNGILTLNVSSKTGFVVNWRHQLSGISVPLTQSWRVYEGANGTMENGSNQASGAYIFRPLGGDPPSLPGVPTLTLLSGPIVNETHSSLAYVSQATRLWLGASEVEFEWTVGPVDMDPQGVKVNVSQEVITRFETGLATDGKWATDSNCRESQIRQRGGWRANFTSNLSEPVAGNCSWSRARGRTHST